MLASVAVPSASMARAASISFWRVRALRRSARESGASAEGGCAPATVNAELRDSVDRSTATQLPREDDLDATLMNLSALIGVRVVGPGRLDRRDRVGGFGRSGAPRRRARRACAAGLR